MMTKTMNNLPGHVLIAFLLAAGLLLSGCSTVPVQIGDTLEEPVAQLAELLRRSVHARDDPYEGLLATGRRVLTRLQATGADAGGEFAELLFLAERAALLSPPPAAVSPVGLPAVSRICSPASDWRRRMVLSRWVPSISRMSVALSSATSPSAWLPK